MSRHILVGLLALVWMGTVTRSVATNEVGSVVLAWSLAPLLVPLLSLGLPFAISHFLASSRVEPFSMASWVRYLAVRTTYVMLAAVGLGTLLWELFGDLSGLYLLAALIVPAATITALIAAVHQGLEDFGRHAALTLMPTLTVTVLTLVLAWSDQASATTIVGCLTAAHWLTAALGLWSIRTRSLLDEETNRRLVREALPYSRQLWVSEVAAAIRARADLYVLGLLVGTSAVGLYGAAATVAAQLGIISQAAHLVVFPAASRYHSATHTIDSPTIPTARLSLSLTLIGAVVLGLGGEPILGMMFGAQYRDGASILIWYLPGVALLGLGRVITADLSGRGEARLVKRISVISSAAGILMLIPLTAVYGVVGSALAFSLTAGLSTAWRTAEFVRRSEDRLRDLLGVRKGDLALLSGGRIGPRDRR